MIFNYAFRPVSATMHVSVIICYKRVIMPIITKLGSVVSRIDIETSPHKKNTVAIYFAEHVAPDLLLKIQRQLQEIGGADT